MIAVAGVLAVAGLQPDPDEARDWLHRELSDPQYAAAEPTLFDRISRAVGDFLANLFSPDIPAGWGPAAATVAAIVVVVVIVVALLVWGRPRLAPRTRATRSDLFGDDGDRSAADLRADAAAAAADERWDDAIILRFRALARALAERVVVVPAPGATAQAFGREAAAAFPDARDAVTRAAEAFDDVRYLRRPGTDAIYADVAALDERLERSRPVFAEEPA